MKSFKESLEIIKSNFVNCFHSGELKTESIPLEESIGRILAEDLFSDIDQPAFNYSAMDGICIKISDNINSWELIGEIRAGENKNLLMQEKEAVLIMTGAMVPNFCNAVIPIEDIHISDKKVILKENVSIKPNQNIRFKGEDIAKDKKVFSKGFRTTASSISEIAACGRRSVVVYKKLKIKVFASGDELISPDEFPALGQVRATNLYSLMGLISKFGFLPEYGGILPDEKEIIFSKLQSSFTNSDMILTTGGVSAGKYDLIPEILKELQCEIHLTKSNIKPGKPMIFATYKDNIPIFALPGNPVSSFVNFHIYILPAILSLFQTPNFVEELYARLGNDIQKKDHKIHFIRGEIILQNEENIFLQKGKQSSGDMAGLGASEYLGIIEENVLNPMKGSLIRCMKI